MIKVYGLRHPDKINIRYVGITKHPLSHRVNGHYKDRFEENHRGHWLLKLDRQGLKPEAVLLEEVPKKYAFEAEKAWIRYLRGLGCDLINSTDGGEGIFGFSWDKEYKEMFSEIMSGRHQGENNPFYGEKHTEETKKKVSEASKKNWENPEFRRKRAKALSKTGPRSGTYKGVSKTGNKWRARIYHDGEHIYLGSFGTPERAAKEYNKAVRELKEEGAFLNNV